MHTILSVLILILVTFSPAMAGEAPPPHIDVYGTATIEVVPDQIFWNLTVRNTGKDLSRVAEDSIKSVDQVHSFLRQQGVPETDIRIADMEYGEQREYQDKTLIMSGYEASTSIVFRTASSGNYKAMWIGLSEKPGVSIRTIQYDHSKRIGYQNETRKQALLKAREKARALAETLGCSIGEPLFIEEDLSWYSLAALSNQKTILSDDYNLGLPSGRIPITCRVKVSFRLIASGKLSGDATNNAPFSAATEHNKGFSGSCPTCGRH